jgi:hypothetical protein
MKLFSSCALAQQQLRSCAAAQPQKHEFFDVDNKLEYIKHKTKPLNNLKDLDNRDV